MTNRVKRDKTSQMMLHCCFHVGLQASLLVRDVNTRELLVNFDPQLVKLMRETECMMKINLEIPESAKLMFIKRHILKSTADDLKVRNIACIVGK
jgi:hypothetical protein